MKSNVRIGLITIHHTTNFGSALQTYALYTALKEIASGVEIIDYRCRAVEDRELLRWTLKTPEAYTAFCAMEAASAKRAVCFRIPQQLCRGKPGVRTREHRAGKPGLRYFFSGR